VLDTFVSLRYKRGMQARDSILRVRLNDQEVEKLNKLSASENLKPTEMVRQLIHRAYLSSKRTAA